MADFSDYFNRRIPRAEGAAFLGKLKTAGLAEKAQAGLGLAKGLAEKHQTALLGAAIAGSVLGTVHYLASKPGASGKSPEQEGADAWVASQEQKDAENPGPHGLPHDMSRVTARTTKSVVDMFAKHPVAAGVTTALVSMPVGFRLLPKLLAHVKG